MAEKVAGATRGKERSMFTTIPITPNTRRLLSATGRFTDGDFCMPSSRVPGSPALGAE